MREMEFKVERNGLLKEGDIVNVIETELESFRYYTIEHAYGMSGNIPLTEPLKNLTGKVVKMEEKPRGYYAVLEFEEWTAKNCIFEKLENYWDTTEDTRGTVINLERQGNYKTAVEEFYEFVDKKTVSIMNRKGRWVNRESEDGMENWKEYRKGEIPRGKYKAKILTGDLSGTIIELKNEKTRIILDFGHGDAVRIVERKFVDLGMYENVGELKENNFSNVIYEVQNNKYLEEIKLYSGGLLDSPSIKQYAIITENLYIDVIYDGEPEYTFFKRIYSLN